MTPTEKDTELEEVDAVGCPHCFALNDPYVNFCAYCNFPMRTCSTLDPIASIQAEGHFYRKAAVARPTKFILICVWLLFLPGVIASLFAAIEWAIYEPGLEGFVFFWICIFFGAFCGYMLYRVTANYLKDTRKEVGNLAE